MQVLLKATIRIPLQQNKIKRLLVNLICLFLDVVFKKSKKNEINFGACVFMKVTDV